MAIEIFGSYELINRLATGGMAQIYLARRAGPEGFEKLMVVKRILPHLSENADFVRMFLDEARIAARLNHPNVVQIFDLGKLDDSYFIAMEYIHGEDVRRVWKRAELLGRPIPTPLVCRMIMDACAGLDYAHKKADQNGKPLGIVHRDISPQNILVTFEGGVKVVDFGIAKAADQATVTRSGVLKGKYSYMSPEQASGQKLDCRSDIFALGVVLFELLTGKRLFKRSNDIQTLHAVTQCEVPPPSQLNPRLSSDLDAIVLKALAKSPADRYQEAIHLQLALEDWVLSHQLPSSSAHLAAFMEELYAERLAEERKAGHVLVEGEQEGARSGEEQLPTTSKSGARTSSIDGRLPSPRGRLTEPSLPTADDPESTTAERRLHHSGKHLVRGNVFDELLKSTGRFPATGERTRPSGEIIPTEPVSEGATLSMGPTQDGSRSVAITHTTEAEQRMAPATARRGRSELMRGVLAALVGLGLVTAGAIYLWSQGRLTLGPAPLAPVFATVRVTSEPPGATVTFNGRPLPDVTPCTLPPVPAGAYPLDVGKRGYQNYRGSVTVPEQGEMELPIRLVPEAAPPVDVPPPPAPPDAGEVATVSSVTLTLASTPPASLWVDGEPMGKTPATVTLEPDAEVEVRLEAPGYQPLTQRVAAGASSRRVGFKLERASSRPVRPVVRPSPPRGRGKVRFAVTPWGNVTCGSFNLGTTPFEDKELPAGVYDCKVTHPEHGVQTKRVEVRVNDLSKVSVIF